MEVLAFPELTVRGRKKWVPVNSGIATAAEFLTVAVEQVLAQEAEAGTVEDSILVSRRLCRSIRRVREVFHKLCSSQLGQEWSPIPELVELLV